VTEQEDDEDENVDPNQPVETVAPKKPTKEEIVSALELLNHNRTLQMTTNTVDSMYNSLIDLENHVLSNY
jgi:hypothetical protein